MLRPSDLAAVNYPAALHPIMGYEEQLYFTSLPSADLGTLEIGGLNSGTFTASVPDAAILSAQPMEVLCMLKNPLNSAGGFRVTVLGTDQNNAALSGTAYFQPPGYSNNANIVFPVTWASEVEIGTGKYFKTITSVIPWCLADATAVKVELFGIPAISNMIKVPCKVSIEYTPKVPEGHEIQCGRDMSAFVVEGEIPVGMLTVTAKVPNESDGLSRFNGLRCTGVIKRLANDQIPTGHTFLTGLILKSKKSIPEGVETSTYSADGKFENSMMVLSK